MAAERDPGRALAPLAATAADVLAGAVDPARDRAERDRFVAFVAAPRARGGRWAFALGALLAAGGAAIALVPRPRTAVPPAGPIAFDTTVERGSAGAAQVIRFSDGSRVRIAEGARAWVRSVDAGGARLALASGRTDVHVRHRPATSYVVEAGPYEVAVVGTAFAVEWTPERDRFVLSMDEGRVIVRGPGAEAGIAVAAGQRLVATGGAVTIGARDTVAEAPAPVELAAAAPEEPAIAPAAPRRNAAPTSSAAPTSWARLVAAGEFARVVTAVRGRGVERCAERCALDDLVAAADAARYVGAAPTARTLLLAARSRFPRTRPARDAAFLLGRLADDGGQPRDALAWYDVYLRDAPAGPFAADALGRRLRALDALGEREPSLAAAAEYVRRFPSGPHAAFARQLLAR